MYSYDNYNREFFFSDKENSIVYALTIYEKKNKDKNQRV